MVPLLELILTWQNNRSEAMLAKLCCSGPVPSQSLILSGRLFQDRTKSKEIVQELFLASDVIETGKVS